MQRSSKNNHVTFYLSKCLSCRARLARDNKYFFLERSFIFLLAYDTCQARLARDRCYCLWKILLIQRDTYLAQAFLNNTSRSQANYSHPYGVYVATFTTTRMMYYSNKTQLIFFIYYLTSWINRMNTLFWFLQINFDFLIGPDFSKIVDFVISS